MFGCSIQEIKQKEFEIVEILSKEFSIKSLCEVMNISRSGYYKWLKTKDVLNRYEINRKDLEPLIRDIHKRKPSYGYHRINAIIYDHNYLRPSYALNYKTPIEYRTQLGFK